VSVIKKSYPLGHCVNYIFQSVKMNKSCKKKTTPHSQTILHVEFEFEFEFGV